MKELLTAESNSRLSYLLACCTSQIYGTATIQFFRVWVAYIWGLYSISTTNAEPRSIRWRQEGLSHGTEKALRRRRRWETQG